MRINQVGDTIVEVLVAIAIASGVLSSAYAIVSRTAKSQQQTSEHTDALKIAESQIELLRQHIRSGKPTDATFCFKTTDSTYQTSLGNCKSGPNNRYQPTLTKGPGGGYRITVTWDGINGVTDNVSLVYKVYQ